jgi:hypothetical protein
MSDNRAPIYKNAEGRPQLFAGEDTLTWNFTSATGNPMELVVGGTTYFTFDRDGALQIKSDITWNSDGGGLIGNQYDNRPTTVNATTKVAVGAISGTGDGSSLTLNRLTIGHGNVDKYIDAEQGLASTPFMRYNAVHARWEFSNDGVVVVPFGAGGGGSSTWDDIYLLDKTLVINSTRLTFNQTSTTDVGFALTRNLDQGDTDAAIMLVTNQHAGDDQSALQVTSTHGGAIAAATLSALDLTATSAGLQNATDEYFGAYSTVTRHASDVAGAILSGFGATQTGAVGSATTIGFHTDDTLDYGLYSLSNVYVNSNDAAGGYTAQFSQQHPSGSILSLQFQTTDRWTMDDAGKIVHVTADPTANFTAHSIATTSGGATSRTIDALDISLAGAAGDSSCTFKGIDLNYTSAGTTPTAYAIDIDANWDYGVYSLSPGYISADTSGVAPAAALHVEQTNTSGSPGRIFEFNDGSIDMWHLSTRGEFGHATETATNAITALTVTPVTTTGGVWAPTDDITGLLINPLGSPSGGTFKGIELDPQFGGTPDDSIGLNVLSGWNFALRVQDSCAHYLQGASYYTTPFWVLDGEPAADNSRNISTANANADMIRVTVEGATRWIPAYDAVALPVGLSTWDEIYDNVAGSTLNVDVTDKPFHVLQTSNLGPGIFLQRTVASAGSGDDDSLLYVLNGADAGKITALISHTGAFRTSGGQALGVKYGGYNEDGMFIECTGGDGDTVPFRVYADSANRFLIKKEGNVSINTFVSGFGAPAFTVTQNHNRSTARLNQVHTSGNILELQQNGTDRWVFAQAGTATATLNNNAGAIDTTTPLTNVGSDVVGVDIGLSRTIAIVQDGKNIIGVRASTNGLAGDATSTWQAHRAFYADMAGTLSTNPLVTHTGYYAEAGFTMGVHSESAIVGAFAPVSGQSVVAAINNSGAGATIAAADGVLGSSTTRWAVAHGGAVAHTPANPTANFDAHTVSLTSGGIATVTTEELHGIQIDLTGAATDGSVSGLLPIVGLKVDYTDAGGSDLPVGVWAGANFVYGVLSYSPIRYFGTSSSESLSVQEEGTADLFLLNKGGTDRFTVGNAGVIAHVPDWTITDPDVYNIDMDLNGLTAGNTARGIVLDVDDGSTSTGGSIYGIDLQYTASGSTIDASRAINVDADWDYGLYSLSAVYASAPTGVAHSLQMDSTPSATHVGAMLAGAGSDLDAYILYVTTGTIAAPSAQRFSVTVDGRTNVVADSAATALKVTQGGAGDVLELVDGSNTRWVLTDDGALTHTPDDPTASFDAHTITMTSGGLTSDTIRCQHINLAGAAGGDTSSFLYGTGVHIHCRHWYSRASGHCDRRELGVRRLQLESLLPRSEQLFRCPDCAVFVASGHRRFVSSTSLVLVAPGPVTASILRSAHQAPMPRTVPTSR